MRPYEWIIGWLFFLALAGTLIWIIFRWIREGARYSAKFRKQTAPQIPISSETHTLPQTPRTPTFSELIDRALNVFSSSRRKFLIYLLLSISPTGISVLGLLLSLGSLCPQTNEIGIDVCVLSFFPALQAYTSWFASLSLFLLFGGPIAFFWWFLGVRAWVFASYYAVALLSQASKSPEYEIRERKRLKFDLIANAIIMGGGLALLLLGL
jgi:hypothetical protein